MGKFGYIISGGTLGVKAIDVLKDRLLELFLQRGCNAEHIKTDTVLPVIGSCGKVEFKNLKPADFVVFWDKDVVLCRLLEKAGYRTYNSSDSIAVCDNKNAMHAVLSESGIPMPITVPGPLTYEGFDYNHERYVALAESVLSYPMIIKEAYGSLGKQVYLIENRGAALSLIAGFKNKPYLFQQYIAKSRGRDVRMYVVGKKFVAAMTRENRHDFRANVGEYTNLAPYEPDAEYIKIAESCARIIGLDYCAVDILFGDNGPLLCEVNSNALFMNVQKCCNIDVGALYVDYILKNS